ncbi:MAG: hypothetical protein IJY92_02315 [Alphaproteobacteria bacterium]|nr:hypothetical protein [Alphaproteobacteria bacterium]
MTLFAPSKEQLANAEQSRSQSDRDLRALPYYELLKAQSKDLSLAVISKEESENLPFIPGLRSFFFATLPDEMKQFVLRANIAGVNITATGENGETFLYMAPETELERTRMITELKQLEADSKPSSSLGASITNEPMQENNLPPVQHSQNR